MYREPFYPILAGLILVVAGGARAEELGKGKVLFEYWTGIAGTDVAGNLRTYPNFPGKPDESEWRDSFKGPVNWADNYGCRARAFLYPPTDGDYTFWIAGDDNCELWLSTNADPANATLIATVPGWTPVDDWLNTGGGAGDAAMQKSPPRALKGGQRYYIEALMKEGGGGDSVSVAWGGPGIGPGPVLLDGMYCVAWVRSGDPLYQAQSPNPANGAVDIEMPLFQWTAGITGVMHDVYFGTNPDLGAAQFMGRLPSTLYFHVLGLIPGTTYYWRIDEVDATGTVYMGNVWTFRTLGAHEPIVAPSADIVEVIDDFESYTDTEGGRIFDFWSDGSFNSTGSRVGHLFPPFAERTIVHAGLQSMPMDYNNIDLPFSRADYDFSTIRDWTAGNVTGLSLWVRGYPPTTTVTEAAGKITMQGEGTDIWNNSDQFTYRYRTLNGDGAMVARVVSTGTGSNTWAKGGVMVRASLDPGAAHAMMVMTGSSGNGASFQWRPGTDTASSNADKGLPGIWPPYYVKVERRGDSLSGHISADNETWTQLGAAQSIDMNDLVYIGLCVSSHAAGEYRTFEFDDVNMTGGVTGAWQTKEIGLIRNSPEPVYIVVESSALKARVVELLPYSNTAVTNVTDWTEWRIPLSQFDGVDLKKVKRVSLQVGSGLGSAHSSAGTISVAQATGGTGTIYFDCFTAVLGVSANARFRGYIRDSASNTALSGTVTFTCSDPSSTSTSTATNTSMYDIRVGLPVPPKTTRQYKVNATSGSKSANFTLTISKSTSADHDYDITVSDPSSVVWTNKPVECGTVRLDIKVKQQ
jgi:hypothetical protein